MPALTPNETAGRLEDEVTRALRVAMAGRGVKWFAGELGHRAETLHHKIDPEDSGHRLTWRDFFRILVRLEDKAGVMIALARGADGYFTLGGDPPAGANLDGLFLEAADEFGDVAKAIRAARDPAGPGGQGWSLEELDRLEREGAEAAAKLRQVVAAARIAAARPDPGGDA